MTCPRCEHQQIKKFGFYGKARIRRFRCKDCGATFAPQQPKPLGNHTTDLDRVVQLFTLLTEGMSIRAASRVTGIHKTTICSLLLTIGIRCAALLDSKLQNLKPRYVQADEAWTFCFKKQRRLQPGDPQEWGDQYVWLALDSDAKLIMAWRVGKRDAINAYEFIGDLSQRIVETHRCQLTTDGLEGYIDAVEEHFGADIDFAQLVKQYAAPRTDGPDWFRPSSHVVAAVPTPIMGNPKMERISTSHIERTNLTVRMHLRRFTRLTNGFSKKLANLQAAVAVFVAWYNFCRVHQTLRVTPAMEVGITDHVWTLQELLSA
jgi:transposase-like protein/IS1 family transposase